MTRTVLALGCAGLLIGAGCFPVPVLHIVAVRSSQVVFATAVHTGERVSYGYIHSVERSPVEEFFQIDGSYRLALYATAFRSMNTGLPSAAAEGERFERTPEGFRLSNMRRVYSAIELWVHEDYQNALTVGSRRLPLPALAGNTLLRVSVGRVPVAEFLYWRWVISRRLRPETPGGETRGKNDHGQAGRPARAEKV